LKDEAIELKGLKNFLKDLTLISEREAIEVTLFEEYLIFAQIFGIAKQVQKDFKKLYPDIIEGYNYTYSDILFISTFAHTSISAANTAQSVAQARASSYGGRWSADSLLAVAGGGSFGGRWSVLVLVKITSWEHIVLSPIILAPV